MGRRQGFDEGAAREYAEAYAAKQGVSNPAEVGKAQFEVPVQRRGADNVYRVPEHKSAEFPTMRGGTYLQESDINDALSQGHITEEEHGAYMADLQGESAVKSQHEKEWNAKVEEGTAEYASRLGRKPKATREPAPGRKLDLDAPKDVSYTGPLPDVYGRTGSTTDGTLGSNLIDRPSAKPMPRGKNGKLLKPKITRLPRQERSEALPVRPRVAKPSEQAAADAMLPSRREARRQRVVEKLPAAEQLIRLNEVVDTAEAATVGGSAGYGPKWWDDMSDETRLRKAKNLPKGSPLSGTHAVGAQDFPMPETTEAPVEEESRQNVNPAGPSRVTAQNLDDIADPKAKAHAQAKLALEEHEAILDRGPDWKDKRDELRRAERAAYQRTKSSVRATAVEGRELKTDIIPATAPAEAHVERFEAHIAAGDTKGAEEQRKLYWSKVTDLTGARPGAKGICGSTGCPNTTGGDKGVYVQRESGKDVTKVDTSEGGALCPSCEATELAMFQARKPHQEVVAKVAAKAEEEKAAAAAKQAAQDKADQRFADIDTSEGLPVRNAPATAKPAVRQSQDASSDADADAMMAADAQAKKQQEIAAGRKVELP